MYMYYHSMFRALNILRNKPRILKFENTNVVEIDEAYSGGNLGPFFLEKVYVCVWGDVNPRL